VNKNLVIVSPSCTADSAVQLASFLEVGHVNIADIHDAYEPDQKIINWGCSRIEGFSADRIVLNKPGAVRRSLNKLTTFKLLSDKVRMPTMTLDKEEAKGWAAQGRTVVCRNRIKGCKGQGITKSKNPSEIESIEAKFYTRFIANCDEYRINVYKGRVLTVYYKEPAGNDFRFKIKLNEEEDFQECVQEMINAVHEHLKLDMFGLDVLHTPKGKYFLLEVNSAPILFPITIKRLAKEIKKDFVNG
jgi:glutathione synthase/RimK-type ligase-like ATP-grasp enzyme